MSLKLRGLGVRRKSTVQSEGTSLPGRRDPNAQRTGTREGSGRVRSRAFGTHHHGDTLPSREASARLRVLRGAGRRGRSRGAVLGEAVAREPGRLCCLGCQDLVGSLSELEVTLQRHREV